MQWIRGGPSALDRDNIRSAVHDSLQRLQTDYLDLFYLHWPERNVPMFGQYQFDPQAELDKDGNPNGVGKHRNAVRGVRRIDERRKIRAIGLSNEQPWA